MKLGDKIQSADWKKEKHVPALECPDTVEAGAPFTLKVSVGKDIPHPNTTEHYISWVDVFFQPEKGTFTYHIGRFEFASHGESAQGANQGPAYTHPEVAFSMQINAPGALLALSLCNIHGLWESSKEISLS